MPPKANAGAGTGLGGAPSTSKDLGKRVTVFSKQLIMLTAENFYQWDKSLKNVIYSAKWKKGIIDLAQENNVPWDGQEESDDEDCEARRDAYDVMRMRVCDKLQYMIEDLRAGDARELYARLSKRFTVATTGYPSSNIKD